MPTPVTTTGAPVPTVIFVCKANRYRSPLAEAMFHKCLQSRANRLEWKVSSAGIWAEPGLPALPHASRVADKLGLSLDLHRSRPVDAELLSGCSLIVVMEAGQREALLTEFHGLEQRVFLLSELATGVAFDIPDLFDHLGRPTMEFGEEVCHLVEQGYQAICQKAIQLAVETPLGG